MRAPWPGLGGQRLAPHWAPAPQLQLRLSLVSPTGKHSEVLPALSVTRGGFGHCPKGFGFLHSLQPSPAISCRPSLYRAPCLARSSELVSEAGFAT